MGLLALARVQRGALMYFNCCVDIRVKFDHDHVLPTRANINVTRFGLNRIKIHLSFAIYRQIVHKLKLSWINFIVTQRKA